MTIMHFSEFRMLKEAVDRLHTAFAKSRLHTKKDIPAGEDKPTLKAGVFNGAHGWVHPDGTYYHINQPRRANDRTERHHADVAGTVLAHIGHHPQLDSDASDVDHLLQHGAVRVSAWGKELTLTSQKALTDKQALTIARALRNYDSIFHAQRSRRAYANRAEHPGQMFVAKARDALRLGQKY